MAMFGKSKRGTWYGTLLGIAVGLGLGMGSGGRALATESENGEAEAAPAVAINERAAGRLETPEPERDPVNPARIVAHTAQLPKSRSKPLFPVELPGAKSGPQVQAPSASPGSGGPGSAPSSGPAATADQASARPAPGVRAPAAAAKAGSAAPTRRVRLPLAPSAAEIRREIADRNGGPLPSQLAAAKGAEGAAGPGTLGAAKEKPSLGSRLQERATAAPKQNPRWPTHVDYSAGPTGPAGGNTSGDRKGALIEATGPQQGVIRNRW